MKNINENFHKLIAEKVSPQDYELWISNIKIIKIDEKSVSFSVPTDVARDYIEDKFFYDIVEVTRNLFGKDLQITLVPEKRIESIPKELNPFKIENIDSYDNSSLNPRYTFEEFVVGKSNELSYTASLSVAKNPGNQYNPLFIYGKSGLGKTHLLNAIGNYIKKNDYKKKICYLSTERFLNEYIFAIQEKKVLEFRNKYRDADVLLIDDVQFLNRREGTQEEIFHTFNALYESNNQIVLTSDRPPHEIPNLEQRLVTRFQSGLVVDIQPPDFETRLAILRRKIENDDIQIPDEILNYIALNIKHSVRELNSAILGILARASLNKAKIDISLAKLVVSNLVKPENQFVSMSKKFGPKEIKKIVADYYKISESQLVGKRRTSSLVIPRQVAAYLLKKYGNLSLKETASELGKKDHSTIIHAIKKIESELNKKDSKIKEDIDSIISLLNID
uniref:Chromosomal replication initiator protein DnaA n=1 Tax=candidate division WOR-3 bacterium TaxID=2052148 RepID=A0A7C3N7Q1_UNCW3